MSYFSKFPMYAYDLQDNQQRTLITDILRRVNMKGNARANTLVFDQYVGTRWRPTRHGSTQILWRFHATLGNRDN